MPEHRLDEVPASPQAAERLYTFPGGPLAARYDMAPFTPGYRPGREHTPVWLAHVTEAGRAHVERHLDTYVRLYPDLAPPEAGTNA